MTPALSHLLSGLFDYAGLFPPAELAMEAAVGEYLRHRDEPERWMLGRFIVPAGRLEELEQAAAPAWTTGPPWELAVLISGRGAPAEALAAVRGQAETILACEERWSGRVRALALESPLAPGPSYAGELAAAVIGSGLTGREIYLELPADADAAATLAQVAAVARAQGPSFARVGAKLRCGGVNPEAFPSCERVAQVIAACRDLELPLKCTAGLHHPVRHRATEPNVMMHGFLNVFGAGLLAFGLDLELAQITACIAETDPDAFRFDAEGFSWRETAIDADTVARLRSTMLGGFGSCSFDEPRADLVGLGLL